MIVRSGENWTWDQLDPTTKIVVAAFAGEDGMIGDDPGELSKQEFEYAYHTAFPHKKINFDMKPDEESEPLYSLRAIRNSIINALDRERTKRVTEEMAQLAGGDYMTDDMADTAQAGLFPNRVLVAQEAVRRIDVSRAFDALESLGTLAIARMASPEES
jgi:hypothetical protein